MKQKVLDFLEREQIPYEITEHEPVYTMDSKSFIMLTQMKRYYDYEFIAMLKVFDKFSIAKRSKTAFFRFGHLLINKVRNRWYNGVSKLEFVKVNTDG